ncbi:MAG: hypothetical protein RLZZ06_529 [Actinomycetota bacterium]
MKRATRTLLSVVISALLALSGLVAAPANATVEWVSTPTWQNLHAKIEDGVFERVRREFDTSSRLQVDSETQHNIAWVRTDRNSVTVQYLGGVANAGRKVQFVMSGDVAFTDSISDPDNIAITDSNGVAEVTLTLGVTPVAETDLRVGLSAGDGAAAAGVGNLVLDWQDPGFFPIIKLIGSGQGFTSQCLYRAENAQHQVSRAHECTNGGFQEFTWAWSVFKKDWLPEYSQVYVKSYKFGSTLNLVYRVTDIWGTPQVNRDVHLIVDQGCRLCRWYNYDADKSTDANGIVSYSVRNRNTYKEVFNNRFVNSDTKAREGGFIAFSIQPTTNALDESADYMWPQLVTDVNIKASASTVVTVSRGGQDVNAQGDYVTTVNGQSVTNPPLNLDTLDAGISDLDVVTLNISYMKNSLPIALYSPEIRVEADNGGRAAIFDILRPITGLASASSFQSPLVFDYTYPQKIALMCTKTGLTTFKIYTGTAFKTHTMSCKNSLADAKNIEAVPANPAVPATPAQAAFKVTDRWGNPVAGVSVHFATSGTGSLTGDVDVTTGEDGLATANLASTDTGNQIVTASISDPGQVTQAASGTNTITSTIAWGAPAISATPAPKSISFGLFNLIGQKVTILEGKAKAFVTPTLGNQVFVKKYSKGKHTLKVSAGSLVRTFVITVP